MIERKKKKCVDCGELTYIWAHKRCKRCSVLFKEKSCSEGTKIGNKTMYSFDKYKKRKEISPISDKKAKELAKYRKLRDEYLAANNRCEAQIEGVCIGGPVDLHHRAPRAFNLCNVDIFMSCCRPCHNHIHDNSEWSFEKGFLISKHE